MIWKIGTQMYKMQEKEHGSQRQQKPFRTPAKRLQTHRIDVPRRSAAWRALLLGFERLNENGAEIQWLLVTCQRRELGEDSRVYERMHEP